VTMLWLKAPPQFVMLTLLPLAPTLATIVIEAIGLGEFDRMFDLDVRWRDYVKLVVGAGPYQLVLAVAAIRAAVREGRGERGWEKTEHVGAHRSALDLTDGPDLTDGRVAGLDAALDAAFDAELESLEVHDR
jgi:hypothetical protein